MIQKLRQRRPFEAFMLMLVIVALVSLVVMPLWINGGKPKEIIIEQEYRQ